MDEDKSKVMRTPARLQRVERTPEFAFTTELDSKPPSAPSSTPTAKFSSKPNPRTATSPQRTPALDTPTPPRPTSSMPTPSSPDNSRPVRRIVRSTVRPTSGLSHSAPTAPVRLPSTPDETPASHPPLPTPPPETTRTDTPRPVVDYRQQVERQQKEQKSTTSLLAMAVYGLIALVLGGSALAGYGTYVIFGELSDQKATAEQIRADLADNLVLLNQRVETLSASFVQEQNRNQEETLKLRGDLDTLSAQTQTSLKAQQTELAKRDAALKARQNEIKELQGRINRIERRLDLPTPAPKPQANN